MDVFWENERGVELAVNAITNPSFIFHGFDMNIRSAAINSVIKDD